MSDCPPGCRVNFKKESVASYLAIITLCEEIIAGEVNFKIFA